MSYTKLANSILTSTIWMEDDQTRIVWFTLLAMADKNGEVQASIPGLANVARVPLEGCRTAIMKFLSPDPDSRTKDDEGRRIEEIKGGWFLINHPAYRELASDDDRKKKAAERQQRLRDRLKLGVTARDESRQIPQAEAEAEADSNSKADSDANTYIQDSSSRRKRQTPSFSNKPDSSWTARHQDIAGSMRESFAQPQSMIFDVLRFFRVTFDLKGVPLESEWREKTSGQSALEVFDIFAAVPEGSLTLPSHYAKVNHPNQQRAVS